MSKIPIFELGDPNPIEWLTDHSTPRQVNEVNMTYTPNSIKSLFDGSDPKIFTEMTTHKSPALAYTTDIIAPTTTAFTGTGAVVRWEDVNIAAATLDANAVYTTPGETDDGEQEDIWEELDGLDDEMETLREENHILKEAILYLKDAISVLATVEPSSDMAAKEARREEVLRILSHLPELELDED